MMATLVNYKARNFLAYWGKDVDEFVMGTEWPEPSTPLYDELQVPAWVDPEKRAEARRRRDTQRGGESGLFRWQRNKAITQKTPG